MPRNLLLLVGPLLGGCPGPVEDTEHTDTGAVADEVLSVVGFNVESGDADAAVIADVVAEVRGEGIWGFSEVRDASWAATLADAAGRGGDGDFEGVIGSTGYEIRLAIAWDRERYELIGSEELHEINVGGTARAPLVAHLRTRSTGTELLFMVNHLWRSEADSRHEQATLLNQWGRQQTLPVIAVGDYNFDWDVDEGDDDHDEGYDLLTEDDVFRWVRPEVLIQTQCSTYWDSVLDFVFVSGEAAEWQSSSEILFPEPTYCHDDDRTSDHRPVAAELVLPGGRRSR